MARAPDQRYDEAYKLFLQGKKLIEIANQLNLPEGTVRRWKSTHKWDSERSDKKSERSEKKNRGGQPGNKNSVGHSPSVPEENKNAEKFGFFSKYLPEETKEIFDAVSNADPIELLWHQIQIAYAAIVRAQQIMHVKDKDDLTKELKRSRIKNSSRSTEKTSSESSDEEFEYELQFAWDKQSNFLQAQARQQTALNSMIKQYEELCKSGLATEEQKARIEKLKAETKKLEPDNQEEGTKYTGIPASMIAPAFIKVVHDIEQQLYNEYVFPGGRGSTKSSFISLAIIDLLEKNPEMHAVVYRQVADTLRDSVYAQVCWAIQVLGLEEEYKCTVSPMEIKKKSTGQKIFFRGCDDPLKSKSIKPPTVDNKEAIKTKLEQVRRYAIAHKMSDAEFEHLTSEVKVENGYIGILWFEELDQFSGPEAIRSVTQSVIRGGEKAYIFKSFNPPKSSNNWANKYIKVPKAGMLVTWSNYLDVPKHWLGKPFLDEAEFLKEVNPTAYENEYMGVANGTGGNVFDNVTIRRITDQEIAVFDRIYNGIDWGWYPDPWAFNRMYYNAAQHRLIIFEEDHRNKTKNAETARILKEEHGITPNDKLTCDSAEEKSIADYKDYGLFARGAIKGPGSVEYSMKWLQSLTEIVIDNTRTPHTSEEFLNYEYDRDKEGNVISGYPDRDNHHIDDIRYALEEVWRRRGQ